MKNIIIFLLLLTLSLSKPHFNANFFKNNNNRNNNRNGFGNNFNDNNNNNNFFIGGEEIKNTKTETQEEPNKRIPSSFIRNPARLENEVQQEKEASNEQQLLSNTVPQKFEPTKYSRKPHKLHEKNIRPKLKFNNEPFNPYGPNSKNKFFGRREKFIPIIPKINFEKDLSPEQVQNKIFPITEELKNLADTPEQKVPPQQFDRFYEILNEFPDLEPIYEQIQNLNNIPLNQMNEDYINESVNKINELKNEISDSIKESNENKEETNENIVKSVIDELNKIIDNEIVDKNQILKNYENIIQIVNNDILNYVVKSYEKINNVEGNYVPISYVQETINDLSLNMK